MRRKCVFIFFVMIFFSIPCFSSGSKDKRVISGEEIQKYVNGNNKNNNGKSTSTIFSKYSEKYMKEMPSGIPTLDKNATVLNLGLVMGIQNFYGIMYRFGRLIRVLCIGFCFLCIIANAFKLWLGTTEIKKMFADVLYKSLFCTILVLYFPVATDTVLNLATYYGASLSGGYEKINTVFGEVYTVVNGYVEKGLAPILALLEENAYKDGEKKWVSADVISQLQDLGMDEERAKQTLAGMGISTVSEVMESFETDNNSGLITGKFTYVDESGNTINSKTARKIIQNSKKTNKITDNQQQKEWTKKLYALMKVVSENSVSDESFELSPNESFSAVKSEAEKTVKKAFYNPWLVDKDNKQTMFLAPSALMKTVIIMGEVVSVACGSEIDGDGRIIPVDISKEGSMSARGLERAIVYLIYKFGMIIATIFVIIEYTIMILEYYLVRGLATLLIPMMFLDMTKSYAQNLIRLLFSYFLKILVTVLCCFFAMGLFLDILMITMQDSSSLTSSLTVFNYGAGCLMGMMIVFSSSKIAGVVMSGNPALGAGDVVHFARSAVQTAHEAQSLVGGAVNGVFGAKGMDGHRHGGIVGMGQNAVNKIGSVGAKLDSASEARSNAFNAVYSAGKEEGYSDKDIIREANRAGNEAGFKAFGNSVIDGVKDSLHQGIFGFSRNKNDGDGTKKDAIIAQGKEFTDENKVTRKATADDVRKHANAASEKYVTNAKNKSLERLKPPKKPDKKGTHPEEPS